MPTTFDRRPFPWSWVVCSQNERMIERSMTFKTLLGQPWRNNDKRCTPISTAYFHDTGVQPLHVVNLLDEILSVLCWLQKFGMHHQCQLYTTPRLKARGYTLTDILLTKFTWWSPSQRDTTEEGREGSVLNLNNGPSPYFHLLSATINH